MITTVGTVVTIAVKVGVQEPAPVPPPTRAADGTNYAACAKGTCEVAVSAPVRIPVPGGVLTLTRVAPGGVDYRLDAGERSGSGTFTSACGAIFQYGADGFFASCRGDMLITPITPRPGTTRLQMVNRVNGSWILRIVSG